jgi:glutamate racemase
MKVVYKSTIKDEILKAKLEASIQRKEIDKIVITKEERDQLVLQCTVYPSLVGDFSVYGVDIEVK